MARYLNNPDAALPLSVDPEAPDRDARLLAVARGIVPAWSDAAEAAITAVSGGITNLLFKLSAPGRPPLLVRIYGRNTEVVIDRVAENRLFAELSRIGFAPTYHGRFRGGRVEGFCEGYRALEPQEMGLDTIRPLIAAELRAMHAIPVHTPPALWSTLRGWMAKARALRFEGADAGRHAALELGRYDALLGRLEAEWRRAWRPAATRPGAAAAARPVLAHNDLLSGNVLYDESRGRVRFIDYEYGACAPAGFDVANHFCEYAGFDSDFEAGFPSRAVRDDFAAAYLPPTPDLDRAQVIADFSRIVEFFVIPDHLWWGTWAVIQAAHSPIDFDYLEYARLRLAGCDLHRRALDICPE